MITREWLEKHLPPGEALRVAAERETEMSLGANPLGPGLRWLAAETEKDRWPRPPWKGWDTPGEHRFETAYPVSARGLIYKGEGSYLTAEGWPLGTRCWYVAIECGWREIVAAEDPETAVLRAIVVFGCTRRRRDIAPEHRGRLEAVIDEAMRL